MKGDSAAPSTMRLGVIIWFVAALFFLYEFFLRTFIGSIAHQVIPDLNLSIAQFSLLSMAYYIAYGAMQIPVGILTDQWGVKRIMMFATFMCALATCLFAHSFSFTSAFIGRLLMGFGSSFAFVCLLVIASTWFPKRYFAFFIGASQFIGTMGPVLAGGPFIVLLASVHESWRVILTFIGFAGFGLTVLTVLLVKNKPRGGEQAMLYLSTGQSRSESIWSKLSRLLKSRQVWVIGLYSAAIYVAMAIMAAAWGTDYLESRGLTQANAASMISIAWIAYAIGCPLIGLLSDLSRRRKPWLIVCAVIGLIASSYIVFSHTPDQKLYILSFALLGFAATGQNVGFAAVVEQSDVNMKATALGFNNGMITGMSAVMLWLTSVLISHASHGHAKHLLPHDFVVGLSLIPLMYLIAFGVAVFGLKETFCKSQKEMIILNP